MNIPDKLIKFSEFDLGRRRLATRMIKGTIALLGTTNVANASNLSGLVKAAVHKKVYELPDDAIKLGLDEPNNSPVGRIKRWVAQASIQVMKWSKK